jgi:hypothetical protein
MNWTWSSERGWEERPTPYPARETPVTAIGQPDTHWQAPAPPPVNSALADLLAANGIQRAEDVIPLAAAAHLDLAAACAMLQMESAGGFNCWGHDGVDTGGCYVKGAPVTQVDYLKYKARRAQIGCQGVGPCQLTYYALQDQADAIGPGCWDWTCNVKVGFGVLANNIRAFGLRAGFARYNGSGPAADAYATKAMAKYLTWQARISGVPVPAPNSDGARELTDEERGMIVAIYQFVTGSAEYLPPGTTWPGWPSWAGGTDEHLSATDYQRRANVEIRQSWDAVKQLQTLVQALQTKLESLSTGPGGELGQLSEADRTAIAQTVVGLLAAKMAAGGG